MTYKYTLKMLLFLAFFGFSFWAFNHINAWFGIILGIVGGFFTIEQFFKSINK